ncbi:MAG: ABC transporter ATP-binding protein [Gammaproteobacteria bacterium]|nr:ABC transporter ATP-binding protein [Gammaproteobacteria bacterium]MBP9728969.1 ABC transporter ATP-binding protein [Gammaproteobacteria bacterium]
MLMAPILGAFYDVANNYAIKLVVDAFSQDVPVSYATLGWPIALFISAQIVLDVLWRGADIAEWRSEPYVRQAILLEVYDHIQHNPYLFFQNTQAGSISSKIKGIVDGYDHFWAAMHHEFTPKAANTIVLTAALAIVNLKVCLFVSLWGLGFFIIMYRFATVIDKLSFANANDRHAIFGLIADNIANILTVFSFATRKKESKRLNTIIEERFIPSTLKVYKFSFLSSSIAAVLYWLMMISLFIFMIHLRKTNQVSTGDLVFVMGLTIKMSWELWQMIQKMQDLMKDIGDFKSAFSLLKMPQEKEWAHTDLKIVEPSIAFEKVSFAYEDAAPIFSDLSLQIKAGEKVGLVGVSGAGKSTLVSLLLKYFQINQGQILIDGKSTSTHTADSVRSQIAVIPQDILLFHRSILDNIRYGCEEASEQAVIDAARAANIHDFIMGLPEQYQTFVGERGVKLSGGQRQRIAIARAILKYAPILILDEATSSLDAETERLIQSSLNRLLEDSTVTVLAIAHRLSTLKHMDRIIVLQQGKIIEEGTHQSLIAGNSLYKKLWDMQKI